MADERDVVTLKALSRWMVVAVVLLVGLVLYFMVGRPAASVIHPPVLEAPR